MKLFTFLVFLSSSLLAQNLTPQEQQRLLRDVQVLKEKVQKLEGAQASEVDQAQAQKMLETIQKGKLYQEEQMKALQELDEE